MVAIHMEKPAASLRKFRIGRVISRAVQLYAHNFIFATVIVAVFFAINIGGAKLITWMFTQSFPYDRRTAELLSAFAVLAVVLIAYMSGASLIMQAMFQYLREGRASLGDAFRRGFARAPAMVFMGIMIFLLVLFLSAILAGVFARVALLIFPPTVPWNLAWWTKPSELLPLAAAVFLACLPGLFLFVIWNVGTAACIAEDLGPIRALGRSRKLTQGFRWQITLLVIMVIALSMLPSGLGYLFGTKATSGPIYFGLLAFSVVINAYLIAVSCTTFVDLRQAKEGRDIEKLASVFE